MASSIDSNVFVALWDDDANNLAARNALDGALGRGHVIVAGPVYAELMGGAGRSNEMLNKFFEETRIEVDWRMDRLAWERAGSAYQGYVARRRRRKGGVPRPMLTDFLIGAHAVRYAFIWSL